VDVVEEKRPLEKAADALEGTAFPFRNIPLKRRKFHTLLVGDKYPPWYAHILAKALQKWDVELECWIDKEMLKKIMPNLKNEPTTIPHIGIPNLWFRVIDEKKVPDIILKAEKKWWYKMLFFNPDFVGEDQIWFVDLDTVFLKDPDPIFHFMRGRFPCAFTEDAIFEGVKGTCLFFIDFTHPKIAVDKIWKEFKDLPSIPKKPWIYGDQDFVTEHLPEGRADSIFYPPQYCTSFKVWFRYSGFERFRKKVERFKIDDFISFHFHGWPDFVQVAKEKLQGFDELEKRLPDLIRFIMVQEEWKRKDA
jgi:hypothetical protein